MPDQTKAHMFSEGDRVVGESGRVGTVVQVSSTQPHITWVDWDGGPRWQMVGTAHLSLAV